MGRGHPGPARLGTELEERDLLVEALRIVQVEFPDYDIRVLNWQRAELDYAPPDLCPSWDSRRHASQPVPRSFRNPLSPIAGRVSSALRVTAPGSDISLP